MPFKRRFKRSFKRRNGKKRIFRRARARQFGRRVRAVIYRASETKYYEQNVSQNFDTSTIVENDWVNGLGIGNTNLTRIGRSIVTKTYLFNFGIFLNQGAALTGSDVAHVRIMVLYPRKTVDSATVGTYLTATQPGLLGLVDPAMAIVVWDKFLTLYTTRSGNGFQTYKKKLVMRKRHLINYATDSTVDRFYHFYVTTDLTSADATKVNFTGNKRLAFKDI